MSLFVVSGLTAGIYIAIETYRYSAYSRALKKIKHRIHVNGSRGKSSTTRLIAAVLRADKRFKVIAKTTGTAPFLILPDGSELPIFRAGRPNIIEQLRVTKAAVKLGANVFVTECMAITPEYMKEFEEKLVKSTIA